MSSSTPTPSGSRRLRDAALLAVLIALQLAGVTSVAAAQPQLQAVPAGTTDGGPGPGS
jgi:hypothetical protein